ncbi:MAG: autoinducer binding domain-containing protein [Rubrivivax sp.]|nr:autoinducer binding domain-containing protein [Rubrivivax sp.]
MQGWQEELLWSMDGLHTQQELFAKVQAAARAMGFEYCAYGVRVPVPLTQPRFGVLSAYPEPWQRRYSEARYLAQDPTVLHGLASGSPVLWTDQVFSRALDLWREAQSFGVRHGWAQATHGVRGVVGMLSLARGHEPINRRELLASEPRMRWLACLSHAMLGRHLVPAVGLDGQPDLTPRELEVLKWTGDGKTASEVGNILAISQATVHFHLKNVVSKFGCANKTAAVVRAALLGLLS